MSYPGKGSADFLREGDWNSMCWECGRKKKASELWKYWQGYWICPSHWNPRQPQDFAKGVHETITPPWVQPMASYIFSSSAPLVYEETVNGSTVTLVGNTLSFTPDFSAVSGAAMLTVLDGSGNYIGPYYMNATITEAVPVVLTLTNTNGVFSWS